MALTNKLPMPKDATKAILHASSFYEHNFHGPMKHTSPISSSKIYAMNEHVSTMCHEPETTEKSFGHGKNFPISNSSSVSSTPSRTNSNNYGYNLSEEDHSMISFIHASGSLPGFEQSKRVKRNLFSKIMEDEYPVWEGDLQTEGGYCSPKSTTTTAYHGLPESSSSHHASVGFGTPSSSVQFEWLNDQEDETTVINGIEEQSAQETSNSKRPSTGENAQASKKQCVGASTNSPKKPKAKLASPCKDPQSSAAKNRRERISERLKTLQELVPNGSKVDLVTMLEKAIGYVKFLQLQVKVLATDEFWPAPGGKAPDLTQVKEAIDTILTCQRGRNSSTSGSK